MGKLYEVLFYRGDGIFPAYYLIDQIEGKNTNIKKELRNKLTSIIHRVRKMFDIGDDIPDGKIYKTLYVLKEEGLISMRNIA